MSPNAYNLREYSFWKQIPAHIKDKTGFWVKGFRFLLANPKTTKQIEDTSIGSQQDSLTRWPRRNLDQSRRWLHWLQQRTASAEGRARARIIILYFIVTV
jgi:hypothetical protein